MKPKKMNVVRIVVILFGTFITICTSLSLAAQQNSQSDSSNKVSYKDLDSVRLNSSITVPRALNDVEDLYLYAGKKTNRLLLNDNSNGLANNLGRTAFAKIPGLTMWEMDGGGTQLNIGTRGTDPHRSIEMNMRQNGYSTNSDVFGYPENHYTLPLQAVEEVQLVRGSAALQFGPQFGGMLNYKVKRGDSTHPFLLESEQSFGANNFFNSYNAVGGTKGRVNYYAYYDYRHGNGWRNESDFTYHAFCADIGYAITENSEIRFQYSRMNYVQQIAGGLTDAQFLDNPRQAVRSRNYFQPIINIPALLFNAKLGEKTQLSVTAQSLFGERSSVQFINAGNVKDSFNVNIGTYNPRQVDRDFYKGFSVEARLLHNYNLGRVNSTLSTGIRWSDQRTQRRQKGTGTTGSDFDLSLTGAYGTDLQLRSKNAAIFAENIFRITPTLSVVPGLRLESIQSSMDGLIDQASTAVAYAGDRLFPLFGLGIQQRLPHGIQLYGNVSQAYRPYLYSNISPADRLDKIDPNLKDTRGYDVDLGVRGQLSNFLNFDLNGYYVYYGNKVGLLSQSDDTGTHLLTTNIGNAVAKGVELFAELSILRLINGNEDFDLDYFHSLAYNDARYVDGELNKGGSNISVAGNKVENAPVWTYKTGLSFRYKRFVTNLQYSYTAKSFNDAFNTHSSANGVIGEIPAWHVWDWNCNWQISEGLHAGAGINNLANASYFNRRITYYPGPGILPADGRTFYISVGLKLPSGKAD